MCNVVFYCIKYSESYKIFNQLLLYKVLFRWYCGVLTNPCMLVQANFCAYLSATEREVVHCKYEDAEC